MLKEKYGEWALVTGASSGIGEAFAKKIAQIGINLVIIARRFDRLKILAELLEKEHQVKVLPLQLDLTDDNFISELDSKIADIDIGILVNNAGEGLNGPFTGYNPEDIQHMIKLNCIAPLLLTNYYVQKMTQRKKGAIIFISSILGINSTPFASVYSASKAFSHSLGGSLWFELKKNNIDVLTVTPGSTKTEFPRLNKTGKFQSVPEDIVNSALDALGKKIYTTHGIMNKITIWIGKLLPNRILLKVTGSLAENMWKNNYGNQ